MSGDERVTLPPIDTDGRMDILTGLDAPEIFYKFLQKAIASVGRNPSHLLTLLRIRIDIDQLIDIYRRLSRSKFINVEDITSFIEFEVAALANSLRTLTRSDENLVRIGDVTFLVMARISNNDDLAATLARFRKSLAEMGLARVRGGEVVERMITVDGQETHFSVDAFVYETGEEMLDFLQRAGV